MITENEKESLVEIMTRLSLEDGQEVFEVEIEFTNDDVPNYLKNLKQFEKDSRKANIYVRNQYC